MKRDSSLPWRRASRVRKGSSTACAPSTVRQDPDRPPRPERHIAILVLDPDPVARGDLVDALNRAGYSTIAGGHGADPSAVGGSPAPAAADTHADLVVMDPVMPRGIALAASIRFLGTPVVIVSGDAALLDAARKAGFPCIRKPLDIAAAIDALRAQIP